jgi:CheY-like chemotaxis protein
VLLPLANTGALVAPSTTEATDAGPELLLAGLRLLLVDDDQDTLDVIGMTLRHYGAEVVGVTSAAEAFAELQRQQTDVLICDIGMPEEDGYSLIARVRELAVEQGGGVRAIALTAYARKEDRQRALDAGFQRHLPKPVDSTELVAYINEVMAE